MISEYLIKSGWMKDFAEVYNLDKDLESGSKYPTKSADDENITALELPSVEVILPVESANPEVEKGDLQNGQNEAI